MTAYLAMPPSSESAGVREAAGLAWARLIELGDGRGEDIPAEGAGAAAGAGVFAAGAEPVPEDDPVPGAVLGPTRFWMSVAAVSAS